MFVGADIGAGDDSTVIVAGRIENGLIHIEEMATISRNEEPDFSGWLTCRAEVEALYGRT